MMGWLIAVALIIGCAVSDQPVSNETLFMTSGMFAIAGSLSAVANALTKKDHNSNT